MDSRYGNNMQESFTQPSTFTFRVIKDTKMAVLITHGTVHYLNGNLMGNIHNVHHHI